MMCGAPMLWGYWLLMSFGTLAGIALLAVLGWWLLRRLNTPNHRPGRFFEHKASPPDEGNRAALAILEQRYARGEIDAQTFEQMRERLQGEVPMAGNPWQA